MEKLQMCRVCLVKDTRMYVVVSKSLHELYMKLTAKPFVTEDRRPVLVCYFCCTKLKQCCCFQRKCLEAEELYAQMLNENNEPNPLINPDFIEFHSGLMLMKAPMEHISIVGECQTESHATSINEELPADIIEPKEELQFDELEAELVNADSSDVEDIQENHSDSEDNVSITEFKTEVEEEQDTNWAPVAKKPKLHIRRTEQEDVITEDQNKNEQPDSKIIRTTQNRTQFPKPQVNNGNSLNNTTLDTSFCNNSGKDNIKCKILNKGNDSGVVNRHRRLYVKDKLYKCDVCEYSCGRKCDISKHVRIHTNEKSYKCDVCQCSFAFRNNLIRHNKIHNDEKPYKCEICQYSCRQKGYLIQHVRIHTNEKPYKCDVCQCSFTFKNNLITHSRIHTGEKPYKCDVCEYSSCHKGHLMRHIRIHSDEKPYKCDVCEYSCSQKYYLTKHVRKHTNEKPYKCDVCQCSFAYKNSLIEHSMIHTGEKPYKCKVCEYSCRQKAALTIHARTHTNKKPYKCDVCDYSCRQKGDLSKHVRIHTNEKPYKCDVCEYSFCRKGQLMRHSRIHSGEKP